MRILHCIPSMEGGGAERQLAYLAGELVKRGCRVDVALTRGGVNLDRLEQSGATVHHLGPSGSHDPRLLLWLARLMGRIRPDLVQCWLLQMEVLAGLAATARGRPWLFTERSSSAAYPKSAKQKLRLAAAWLADAIVANSDAGQAYWAARLPGSHRYVVPNGVPLADIHAVRPADLSGLYHIGGPTVLFAGRLDDGKNPTALLDALALTSARVSVLFCGEGPLRAELERRIESRGLAARARIAGFSSELWSHLKSARALVSPSRFEGSPNVVLEAMAAGCPLVVSDIPAHRELLDAESALFVEPDDVTGLARALETVAADPAAAAVRAARAYDRVQRQGIARVADQYLAVYQDVLGRRAGERKRVAT